MESAIFNLNAELLKKKEEIEAKNKEKNLISRQRLLEKKPRQHLPKKKKDLPTDKESLELENSRLALERKAALYNKIKDGVEVLESDELNDKFLVNFQKKIIHKVNNLEVSKEKDDVSHNENPDFQKDEHLWVDYIDSFGRTRRCHVDDLEYFKKMDKDLAGPAPKAEDDPYTKKLKEKWTKIDTEASNKRNIHYQDVLYDETREHGVGYMKFSTNEAERHAQQQHLRETREEAKKAAVDIQTQKSLKAKKLQERLEKVRQRKRLKMGLPVKDICEKRLMTPPSSDNEEEPEPIPEPSPVPTETEPGPIRQWDVGKTTINGTVLTQKQWVESRRKYRDNEFAPPKQYSNKKQKSSSQDSKQTNGRVQMNEFAPPTTSEYNDKKQTDLSEPVTENEFDPPTASKYHSDPPESDFDGRVHNNEFAPPATYEYYNGSTKRDKQKISVNIEDAISRGIAAIRKATDNS